MRIMHVLNTGGYSGAENIAIAIIKNINKLGNECVYVSPNGIINNRLEQEGIQHVSIKKVNVKELKRAIEQYKPDIIHAHDFNASITAAMTLTKVPIISHIHCNPPWLNKICLKSLVYFFSALKYRKILLVSEAIKKEYTFSKALNKKMIVVGNFVNEKLIIQKANESVADFKNYDVIFLGRLVETKNPNRFIEIIKQIVYKKDDLKVAIIGNGPMKEEVNDKINKMNLQTNIDMIGFVENPYSILNKSKILCMTSNYEGYGLVAVEAMILEKPVVTTKAGGVAEIVDDSCGKVCKTNEEFITEILKLINDKNYYAKKSKNAKSKLEKINNMNEYIGNLNDIYNQINT